MAKGFDLKKITAKLESVPNEFAGLVAQMGYPKGANYEDGTSVAYVAAIQEFGAPAVKIPARPTLRPTIAEKQDEWVGIIKQSIPRVIDGDVSGFDVLDAVARAGAADIQETIANLYAPELSPITVLLRKWKKEGRKITGKTVGEAAAAIAEGTDPGTDNKPLNATGYLFASVKGAVNEEGKELEI